MGDAVVEGKGEDWMPFFGDDMMSSLMLCFFPLKDDVSGGLGGGVLEGKDLVSDTSISSSSSFFSWLLWSYREEWRKDEEREADEAVKLDAKECKFDAKVPSVITEWETTWGDTKCDFMCVRNDSKSVKVGEGEHWLQSKGSPAKGGIPNRALWWEAWRCERLVE